MRIYTVFILYIISLCLVHSPARAEVIAIREVAGMNFAALQVPREGAHSILVYSDKDEYSGSGKVLFGTPNRGEYMIVGDEETTATFDIQNIRTGSPYVKLEAFNGFYDGRKIESFPHSGIRLSLKGKILYLGAKVTYTNNIIDGGLSPSFDVVVNYE